MTPGELRLKILRARQETVRRLQHEVELFTPMPQSVDLQREILAEEWNAIQNEILRLQVERQQMAYCGEK